MALCELKLDPFARMSETVSATIDPIHAAVVAELAGVDGLALSLNEANEMVRMRDLQLLQEVVNTRFNLVITPTKRIIDRSLSLPSSIVTLDIGGKLSDSKTASIIREAITVIKNNQNTAVSVRIQPEVNEAKSASRIGADYVELDASLFSATQDYHDRTLELEKLAAVSRAAFKFDLGVSVGGGLSYQHAASVSEIKEVEIISIGDAIAGRAVMIGLENAVRDMLDLTR